MRSSKPGASMLPVDSPRQARHGTKMTDPETASFHLLECLRKDPGSADCGRALERIVTLHPMKLRYRELVRAQLAEERLAAVRQQADPLMRSLP
jgi:hypothetical protein